MMKFYTLIFIILFSNILPAQNRISYNIPDIGAPGMNVYMEIIAPHDATGNFGTDAMYLEGNDVDGVSSDNVDFNFIYPDDEGKIVFGPAIVSWDGRMISTQVFVNPDLKPDSDDWETLDDYYKVEFNVTVNGTPSLDTCIFYILEPFHLGDLNSVNEFVLGQGSLGKRSPRGAMLIDSVIFKNTQTYTVSLNDPDLTTPGNQAYLPFILLSKGSVKGRPGTQISVSADDYGDESDAGPGGGGGGGRFCDVPSGNSGGDDGGDGFTGGGQGGYNSYLDAGKTGGWNTIGTGSGGASGISINGVDPGFTPVNSAAESSGGGTGHPFGSSGFGANTNLDENRVGGYGGGSGRQRDWAGGGGGYGEDAEQVHSLDNFGKAHGNIMVVPVAGGSGGASGNPQADLIPDTYCSGSGGGGGGAILIFGTNVENAIFQAIGGLGGDGHDGARGGSGSGGFTGIYSKISTDQTFGIVSGNQRGTTFGKNGKSGKGRLRYDVPDITKIINYQSDTYFYGPTTDTSYYVKRSDDISGTKDPNETIDVYIKPETGNWSKLGTFSSGTNWTQNLTLNNDDIFYFFAVQHIPGNNSGTYDDEPNYVLSQAAGNVLVILKDPDINGDKVVYGSTINCNGYDVYLPVDLWNEGEGPLKLNFQNARFHFNDRGFSIQNPKSIVTLNGTPLGDTDYDSLQAEVKFEYFPGTYNQSTSGIIRDTLIIPNNDPDEDPWKILFEIEIKEFNVTAHLIDEDPLFENPIDSLYLGKVCRGESTQKDFIILNRSPFQISVAQAKAKGNVGFDAILNFSMPLDSDDASSATVFYDDQSTTEDQIFDVLYITTYECPGKVVDSVIVWVDIVDAFIEATAPTIFDDTRVGSTSTEDIIFENKGTSDLLLLSLTDITVNPPYYVSGTTPAVPVTLKPGEQITVSVDFIPSDTINNPKIRFLDIQFMPSDTTCSYLVSQELQGKAIQSDLTISKAVLDFGTIRHCQTPRDTVMLSNSGNVRIEITEQAVIEGANKDDFLITSTPKTIPVVITDENSGGVKYFVDFIPQSPGYKEAELVIKTDDVDNPEIRIRLIGTYEPFNVYPVNSPFDIGNVPVGFDIPFSVNLQNGGYFREFFTHIVNAVDANYSINTNSENTFIPQSNGISISGTLNLQQAGNYNETLIAAFEIVAESGEICYDTVYIDIEAFGQTASMDVTAEIDLGIIPPCGIAIDVIEYSHRTPQSKAPFVILNEALINNPIGLFDISSTGLTYPDTLDVEDNQFGAQVIFDPKGADDGIYTCQLKTQYYINGEIKDTLITVSAEVRSAEYTMADNPLDFGSVILGTGPDQSSFTVTNTGMWTITITDISPIINSTIFTLSPDPIGTVLDPGESASFDVTFEPAENIEYSEELTLEFTYSDDNCVTTDIMNLRGKGGVTLKLQLRLPDLTVTPDLENYKIPLYGKIIKEGDTDDLTDFTIDSLAVSFNRTLFYPVSMTKGTILSNYTDNFNRYISVNIPNISLTEEESIITEFTGYTMLGNLTSTPLDIDYAGHSQFNLVSEIIYLDGSGSLTIEVCEEGGDRLLEVITPDEAIIATPNPAKDEININMNLLEKGNHRLQLSDINGNLIDISNWTQKNSGAYKLKYNSTELASGMYYLILTAPSRTYTLPVFIIK